MTPSCALPETTRGSRAWTPGIRRRRRDCLVRARSSMLSPPAESAATAPCRAGHLDAIADRGRQVVQGVGERLVPMRRAAPPPTRCPGSQPGAGSSVGAMRRDSTSTTVRPARALGDPRKPAYLTGDKPFTGSSPTRSAGDLDQQFVARVAGSSRNVTADVCRGTVRSPTDLSAPLVFTTADSMSNQFVNLAVERYAKPFAIRGAISGGRNGATGG
jgi:hypothetical protein